MKILPKAVLSGIGVAILFFLFSGIVAAVIPNPWFIRMTSLTKLDIFFLVSSSLLLGVYAGIYFFQKHRSKVCSLTSSSGGIAGFFSFACPVCNKLLVLLFGTSALLTYLEPMRPFLGFLSILLLSVGIYWQIQNIRKLRTKGTLA